MSQENVEIVRRSFDAFARRDFDVLRTFFDPGVEWDWSASVGWVAGVYSGFDAVACFWAEYFDAFNEIAIEVKS